jgi:hypothetical protein
VQLVEPLDSTIDGFADGPDVIVTVCAVHRTTRLTVFVWLADGSTEQKALQEITTVTSWPEMLRGAV